MRDTTDAVATTGDPTVPPLPRSLQVEVTATCNLRCRMCLVRYRPPVDRLTGSMPAALFARLLDDLPDLEDVVLQGLGEPLLAPDLLEMVRLAHARRVGVGFNTNATALTRRKADQLVAAGLDWLCISLDGASAETYEAIRDGGSFQLVLRNIRGMVEAKRGAGADRPHLKIVFVAMRRNLPELPALVRLAANLGVRHVSVQNLSHTFDDAAPTAAYDAIRAFTGDEVLWTGAGGRDRAQTAAVFAEAREAAAASGVDLRLPSLEERRERRTSGQPGCDWPWNAAYVNADGSVQPCCMVMGADRATLGDAGADGLPAVWRGPAARAFRAALLSDEPPAVCRGCALYRGVF